MAEWLILRMPRAADAAAGWLVADSDGRPLAAVQTGPLEDAGASAINRRVAVLVAVRTLGPAGRRATTQVCERFVSSGLAVRCAGSTGR